MTKVWYISRFRQRYELPDDVRYDRASPLIYTKDFVGSGTDDESCAFWRQLMALRSKKNYDSLRGNFADLKAIAGNQSKEHRGYLLDRNFRPASVKEIGQWLRKTKIQAGIILKELSDVGLLERVELPSFNGSPAKSRGARKGPDKSGKRRKRLKKKTKKKVKINGNGKGKYKKNKKRLIKDKAPPAKTTQPVKPQVFAEKGSVIQFTAPSELKNTETAIAFANALQDKESLATKRKKAMPEKLGDITKKILHRYNPQSKQFAFEIYQALKFTWDPMSEMGRRELGCFASVWQKAVGWQKAGIPLEVIAELRERAISEAGKIAKRRQNRKKGAVWCKVFANLEAAYVQRSKTNFRKK